MCNALSTIPRAALHIAPRWASCQELSMASLASLDVGLNIDLDQYFIAIGTNNLSSPHTSPAARDENTTPDIGLP